MKKLVYILFLSTYMLIYSSCKEDQKVMAKVDENKIESFQQLDGYTLLKRKCYACHNPKVSSHDDLIAPPMFAVKKRYLKIYKTQEEFVKAFTKWVMDPNEESAIMRGAVEQFKVMPKQIFYDEDIEIIAKYIYQNELEKPDWFDSHEQEMHGNGKGMGNGMGRKMN